MPWLLPAVLAMWSSRDLWRTLLALDPQTTGTGLDTMPSLRHGVLSRGVCSSYDTVSDERAVEPWLLGHLRVPLTP